ncbi:cobalamin-binding protein [Thiomicrorhabdus immobilis]|uniref:Cobalamin-binding protein n=1 Tax=Thiomicrorhabdus immobilis TaxID=2791037 RepID=A0ABN6CVY7_9GAMM|nr:cobalamin-binding protein [Thiomicrorhabdus immobilis]BCN93193.1 cobalamin-binding protein [Thiomicrorhabdus immobilis]
MLFDFPFRSKLTQHLAVLLSGLYLLVYTSLSQAQNAPQRVISLAPHITEMLFSAGAGDKVVGVVSYSDYPAAALKIENVGSYHALNIEKIIQLNPDLIIAWRSGNRIKDIEKLEQLGFKVIYSEPYKLADIPKEIRFFGEQLQSQTIADSVAKRLEIQLERLALTYQSKPKVSAFYQIWNAPIMTINGSQFISQALNICGATNVFEDLPILAAEVNIESVIAKDPDTILLGGLKAVQQAWLKDWQKWSNLKAVKNKHIYLLNADTFQRSTERLIESIEGLCQTIDKVRKTQP